MSVPTKIYHATEVLKLNHGAFIIHCVYGGINPHARYLWRYAHEKLCNY